MHSSYDIVIIGNSAAGLSAVKTLRQLSDNTTVALIDREDCPAYSRVLTPYYVGGKTTRQDLYIVDMQFYHDRGISCYFGRAAESVDVDSRRVMLDNGSEVGFRQLLIATGGEARTFPFMGERVLCLRHMADADRLHHRYRDARCVVGYGTGLVTVPLLSHLKDDVEKHVVVSSPRIFSRVVNPEAAAFLEERLKRTGLTIHANEKIVAVQDRGGDVEVKLRSGASIPCDFLIVGKGVDPNVQLAAAAGIKTDWGVLVDEFCRTSVDNIYAAGDVAEGRNFVDGQYTIQGNWTTAVEQGHIAARNMLGIRTPYEGSIKNNITEVFGTEVAVVGHFRDDCPKSQVYVDEQRDIYRKVFLDENDTIIGVTMVGEANQAGVYYGMIRRREKLDTLGGLNQRLTYSKILRKMDVR